MSFEMEGEAKERREEMKKEEVDRGKTVTLTLPSLPFTSHLL